MYDEVVSMDSLNASEGPEGLLLSSSTAKSAELRRGLPMSSWATRQVARWCGIAPWTLRWGLPAASAAQAVNSALSMAEEASTLIRVGDGLVCAFLSPRYIPVDLPDMRALFDGAVLTKASENNERFLILGEASVGDYGASFVAAYGSEVGAGFPEVVPGVYIGEHKAIFRKLVYKLTRDRLEKCKEEALVKALRVARDLAAFSVRMGKAALEASLEAEKVCLFAHDRGHDEVFQLLSGVPRAQLTCVEEVAEALFSNEDQLPLFVVFARSSFLGELVQDLPC